MLVALLVSSLLLALSPTASTEETSRVTIGLNGFENNITPFTHSFGAFPNTHDLVHLVYDSLFWSQARDDPEPWLAESAEPSEDYTTWTVSLRDDVTWHDGTPFTADDVQFSMEYYVEHEADSGRYAHHVGDMPLYEDSEIIDDHTIRLDFAHPAGQFRIMPGADLPILPRHQWEDVAEPGAFTEELPVGTGPYRVAEIVSDQQYRFEANDDYFQGRPLVDELVMPIIQEPAAAFAALQTGDVDYVSQNVPTELIEAFDRADDIEVLRGTIFQSIQLYFNTPREPLDDPQLRKAIALAIDREEIVETVLLGNGEPGRDSYMHPESPWAIDEEIRQFDPDQARDLLDEAGYDQMNGDGIRLTPDGDPLAFTVLVSSFDPQGIRTSQIVAEQVSEVGIDLEVEALDPATIGQRRRAPEPGQEADFDIRVGGLEAHAHVDPDALYYFFHTPGERGFGETQTSYANPEFDEIVVRAGESGDLDERRELLAEAQRILAEDVPMIVVMYPDGIWAHRTDGYAGWIADFGHSPLTKRSFLAEYAGTGVGEGPLGTGVEEAARQPWVWVLVALLVIAVVVAAVFLRRRGADEYE
ncbi:MAG TPA: ABC transporter substrate-binding protein [Egibacteraceae bacterium]|nr:ABC transporter substrate-binding protein [Egibacteraceae bacterium]